MQQQRQHVLEILGSSIAGAAAPSAAARGGCGFPLQLLLGTSIPCLLTLPYLTYLTLVDRGVLRTYKVSPNGKCVLRTVQVDWLG